MSATTERPIIREEENHKAILDVAGVAIQHAVPAIVSTAVPNTVGRPRKPFLPVAKTANPVEKDEAPSNNVAVFPSTDEIVVKKNLAAVYPATDEEHKVRTNNAAVYPATDEVVAKKNSAAVYPAIEEVHTLRKTSAAVFPATDVDRVEPKEVKPTKQKKKWKKQRHHHSPGPGIFRFGHPVFVKPEYASVPEIFGHKQHHSFALTSANATRLKQLGAKVHGATIGKPPQIPSERLNIFGGPIATEDEEPRLQKEIQTLEQLAKPQSHTDEQQALEPPVVATEKQASSSILQVIIIHA